MGTNGHRVIGKASLGFCKALALAGLLITTNARAEGERVPSPSNSIASSPSSGPSLESPPRDSFRTFIFTSTKRDAELQVREPGGWRVVCVGPCRTQAAIGASYRVSGSGVPDSDEVTIPDTPYSVTLRARAGSVSEQYAGAAMITIGTLSLPASYVLFVIASCAGDCGGASQAERDSAARAGAAFLPVFFGGLAMAAVGTALLVGGSTKLELQSGEDRARAPHLRLGRGVELTPTGLVF